MKFLTKADTLKALSGNLEYGKILEQKNIVYDEWTRDTVGMIDDLENEGWFGEKVAVRSSFLGEDGEQESCAGKYTSVLGVSGKADTIAAIVEVFNSFKPESLKGNQVFIQPFLENPKMSGVLFTRDPNTGGPYYIGNYDDEITRTDGVTSGETNNLKTFYQHRQAKCEYGDFRDKLIKLAKELESKFRNSELDIEFSFDNEDVLYLLQVRPLLIKNKAIVSEEKHYESLLRLEKRVEQLSNRHPYLLGGKAIFGVMPDWNPAEIIGVRPKPLALSLYREIVTDSIWAYQRGNYGYRNLRSFPLLVEFEGLPYIDVRVSFNSFVPASLSEDTAEKLVNHYLAKLEKEPALHDKVEFGIVYTCLDFDLKERLTKELSGEFTIEEISEIEDSLKKLTSKIIDNKEGLWLKDLKKIELLKNRQILINESDMDPLGKMYWLIEDCKRYGTLPFAGLARSGFIAVQLLRSLVKNKIFSEEQYHSFLNSLNTVNSQMNRDLHSLSKNSFIEKYGHLRPGTYDILSPRYDECPDKYFDWDAMKNEQKNDEKSFSLSVGQLRSIEKKLKEAGLPIEVLDFMDFIRIAIESREYAKFVFTKSISDFLKELTMYCKTSGIDGEDLAYIDAATLLHLNSVSNDSKTDLKECIVQKRSEHKVTKSIILPQLIMDASDVFSFTDNQITPNYITQKRVIGSTVKVEEFETRGFAGKVVFMESADPGYDWVFSHGISGFVTKYGGLNSHMAIRATELSIPAVIGCGKYYDHWLEAKELDIDCNNKKVTVIRQKNASRTMQ